MTDSLTDFAEIRAALARKHDRWEVGEDAHWPGAGYGWGIRSDLGYWIVKPGTPTCGGMMRSEADLIVLLRNNAEALLDEREVTA